MLNADAYLHMDIDEAGQASGCAKEGDWWEDEDSVQELQPGRNLTFPKDA